MEIFSRSYNDTSISRRQGFVPPQRRVELTSYSHWESSTAESLPQFKNSDIMAPVSILLRAIAKSDTQEELIALRNKYSEDLPVNIIMSYSRNQNASHFLTDTGKYLYSRGQLYYLVCYLPAFSHRYGEPELPLILASQKGTKVISIRNNMGEMLNMQGGDIIPVKDLMTALDSSIIFVGHGFLSDERIIPELRKYFQVFPIKVLRKDFFHLDTFFCPLPGNYCLVYKGSEDSPTTDEAGLALINRLYPGDKQIVLTDEEARRYAANLVVYKKNDHWVIMTSANSFSDSTRAKLVDLGFIIKEVDFNRIQEQGLGSIRCTTMEVLQGNSEKKIIFENEAESFFSIRKDISQTTVDSDIHYDVGHFIGKTKSGIPFGQGIMYFLDGSTYEGKWLAGKKHGIGKFKTLQFEYEGNWNLNIPCGEGTLVLFNKGKKITGMFSGYTSGTGIIEFLGGDRFEGEWNNYEPTQGIYTRDGKTFTGNAEEIKSALFKYEMECIKKNSRSEPLELQFTMDEFIEEETK